MSRKFSRAVGTAGLTAMAAAAMFSTGAPAYADDCEWSSGGSPDCYVEVHDDGGGGWGGGGWGGGGGGYDSGYDSGDPGGGGGGGGGGEQDTSTGTPAENLAAGKVAQENAHNAMLKAGCFTAVTGRQGTSANRRSFAAVADGITRTGSAGNSGNTSGTSFSRDERGALYISFYDDFLAQSQSFQDQVWLITYNSIYGSPSATSTISQACGY